MRAFVRNGDAMRPYAGKRIVGRNYVASCGGCDVPPWECCACSALLPEIEPTRWEHLADRLNAEAQQRLAFVLDSN